MEKISVEIEVSGYNGLTPEKIESALNYYFGTMVTFTVKEAAQQSAQTTGFQPPHGHVFIGGKCECGEEVPLPPFARRQHVP